MLDRHRRATWHSVLPQRCCLRNSGVGRPDHSGAQLFQLHQGVAPFATTLIRRSHFCGFAALMLTIDVPTYGMRERPRRAGLRVPAGMSLNTLMQIAVRPGWAIATLLHGSAAFPDDRERTAGMRIAEGPLSSFFTNSTKRLMGRI